MSSFNDKVYQIVRQIPYGRVMTYGQIAAILGVPRAARAVGYALHWVPEGANVPCQRVVNRFGGLATGYDFGGQISHKADLIVENVEISDEFTVDLAKYQWFPEPGDLPELTLTPDEQAELSQKIPFSQDKLSTHRVKKNQPTLPL